MVDEVVSVNAASILELGSGPGFPAEHFLTRMPSVAYAALDFSNAMHDLARARLGALVDRVTFINKDFRAADWTAGLAAVDAVVTVQAVHELRHKRHAPLFYRAIRTVLKPRGVRLVCDHVVGEGGMTDEALYMTPDEHTMSLRDGGFSKADVLMLEKGLTLLRASIT